MSDRSTSVIVTVTSCDYTIILKFEATDAIHNVGYFMNYFIIKFYKGSDSFTDRPTRTTDDSHLLTDSTRRSRDTVVLAR